MDSFSFEFLFMKSKLICMQTYVNHFLKLEHHPHVMMGFCLLIAFLCLLIVIIFFYKFA